MECVGRNCCSCSDKVHRGLELAGNSCSVSEQEQWVMELYELLAGMEGHLAYRGIWE